jgi:ATP-dependent Zn protease
MSLVPPLPNPGENRPRNAATARVILFWVAMIILAVLLWKLASNPKQQNQSFSSAELQTHIANKNIRSAHISIYHDRALINAERRDSPARFQTYVSNDFVPKIIRQLEENGADVWVQGGREPQSNRVSFLLDVVPFVFLIVAFVIVLRQRQARNGRQSGPARPIDV